MRFPFITLLAFTLAWVLATARPAYHTNNRVVPERRLPRTQPQPLGKAPSRVALQAERERREWGPRLHKRQTVDKTTTGETVASFVLAPETSTTASAVVRTTAVNPSMKTTTPLATPSSVPTTRSTPTTSSRLVASASSTSIASSPSLSSSSSATSVASSSSSSSSSRSRSSSTTSSLTSSTSTSPSAAAHSKSTSIFSPSNRLFALGIFVILAIAVVGILALIFVAKRLSHSARFADHRDYPDGFPTPFLDDKALSKRYSHPSQTDLLSSPTSWSTSPPSSPTYPSDAEDAKEVDARYIEFGLPRPQTVSVAPAVFERPARWSSLHEARSLPDSLKSMPLPPLPSLPLRSSSAPPPPPPPQPPYARPVSPPRGHRKPLPPLAIMVPPSAPLVDRFTVSPRQASGRAPVSQARRGASHPHSPPRGSRLREEL